MIKKLIIALIAIIAGILLVKVCSGTKTDCWLNNKIMASYPKGAINEPEAEPDIAEIYIDASASMKPYFTTSDSRMVYTVSEINNLKKNTQIYFIGKPKPYTGLIADIIGDVRNQPSEATSTFDKFFGEMANRIDTVNTVVYLLTDGIMSIGKNTSKSLVELRGGIENSLKGHNDLAAAIFRYIGDFNGIYYDYTDNKVPFKGERPYFVIALGKKSAIRWLSHRPSTMLNNPEASLYLGTHDFDGHCNKAKLTSGDNILPLENKGQDITLVLDLPNCLTGLDTSSVKLSNNKKQIPVPVENEGGKKLQVQIPREVALSPEGDCYRITMSVANEIPSEWLTTWSCNKDSENPHNPTTFGLSTLIDGMARSLQPGEYSLKVDFVYKQK